MFAQGKLTELKNKSIFTFLCLVVFRISSQVPVPGVNRAALLSYFESQKGGLFSMFSAFTGGALEQFSVVALGVMPYISSSIIFSLLTASVPKLSEIQKEPDGYKKINKWSRYFTVVLCIIQGSGLALQLQNAKSPLGASVVHQPGLFFVMLAVTSLTAGTMFIMWLGEQITERGIGNGVSLLIFAGIISSLPKSIFSVFDSLKSGQISFFSVILLLIVIVFTLFVITFIERSFRKVNIQYAKRVVNNTLVGGQSSHLPIKLNITGVIPPIFAYSLLSFPATLGNFLPSTSTITSFVQKFVSALVPGSIVYNIIFSLLIIFFAYFYLPIQFKTEDLAESLKKNGGFILGVRPGEKTKEAFDFIVNRLTLIGSLYVLSICLLPNMLSNFVTLPFFFGGTSLLILVGVALDTMEKAQTFLISQKYSDGFRSKGKYSGPRRF